MTGPLLSLPLIPLPLRLPPIEGEGFPSYLDRIVAQLPLPVALTVLLYRLGLQESERGAEARAHTGVSLSAQQLRNAAFTLRLPEERLRAMLLTHFDGVAVDFRGLDPDDPDSARRVGLREWAYLVGSHYCPACLAEDQAWRLAWRLPFSFACVRHGALLRDTCPRCGRRAGNLREEYGGGPAYATQKRQPGFCMNPPATGEAGVGRGARFCGQDLTAVPGLSLRRAPRLLKTQARLDAALEARHDPVSGLPALAFFQALRSLCALLLYVAEPGDLGPLPPKVLDAFGRHVEERQHRLAQRQSERRPQGGRSGPLMRFYGATPTSAALMAALLPWAAEALTPAQPGTLNVPELAERLRPLVERLRARGQGHLRMVAKDFNFQGPLLDAFHAVLSGRAGFDHRLGLLSPYAPARRAYDFTVDDVPALLWEDEFRAHFAPLFEDSDLGERTSRAVCSLALVRLSALLPWEAACAALELPATYACGACNKAMGVLSSAQTEEAFARALHGLAARLEAQPARANYRARREALRDLRAVAVTARELSLAGSFVNPGKAAARHQHSAAFVWEQITGGDWRGAPAMREREKRTASAGELYGRFLDEKLPALRPFLLEQAAALAAGVDPGHPRLTRGLES